MCGLGHRKQVRVGGEILSVRLVTLVPDAGPENRKAGTLRLGGIPAWLVQHRM